MNSRLRVVWMLSIAVLCLGSMAGAQDAKNSTVALGTKLSTTVTPATLKPFFDAQTARLKNIDNPAEQSAGREAIIAEVSPVGDKASREYVAAYASEVNRVVGSLLNESPMRTRLNAAIVLARVAEKTHELSLVPTTTTVLNDKSDAVALWGGKAASALMLPYVTTAQPNTKLPLLDAVAKSVKGHPKCGALAEEAFVGLTLHYTRNAPKPADQAKVTPVIQDLLGFRIDLYTKGIPDEPGVERSAAGFLSFYVNQQTPAEQLQTAQLLQDLLAVTVQHAARGGADDRLLDLIRITGSSVAELNRASLGQLMRQFQQVSRGSVFANLEGQLPAVQNALVADSRFTNIKPYPKLPAATPSTTTSTTP